MQQDERNVNTLSSEDVHYKILHDMDEGVMVLGYDGKIRLANPAIERILEISRANLEGKGFAAIFFEYSENDAFNQTVLDAVYNPGIPQRNVAPYFNGESTKYLNIITSTYHDNSGKAVGVIAVMSDITELVEVKERLKMMEQIQRLNDQLRVRNAFIRKAFGKYLSNEIVDQILASPEGLKIGGKQEHVTILMSDLRGFTVLCENTPPEVVMEMLNYYLAKMGEIIRQYHGTIIEYMGDGILATFGAPRHVDNHAELAVAAALAMQMKMEEINQWNKEHGYPPLRMGIGINTGDAVLGNMGSEFAMKYNIIGSCVNMCGRIESYTVDGQLLISPYTKQEIKAELVIEEELEIKPKGVKEPITIYSVQGIKAPYHLYKKEVVQPMIWLQEPVPCMLRTMDGKHVSDVQNDTLILAHNDDKLMISVEKDLAVYDNIVLQAKEAVDEGGARKAEEVYAKVSEKTENGYVVTVTAGNMKAIIMDGNSRP